jgi:hypothetical protein
MKMAGLPNPCLTRFGADSGGGDGGDAAFDAPASNVSQLNQANFLASQKQEAAFKTDRSVNDLRPTDIQGG